MSQLTGMFGSWFGVAPSIRTRVVLLILAVLAGFAIQGVIVFVSGQKHMDFVTYMRAEDWPGRVALDSVDQTVTEIGQSLFRAVAGGEVDDNTVPAIVALADRLAERWMVADALLEPIMEPGELADARRGVRDLTGLSEDLALTGPTADVFAALNTAVQHIRLAKNTMARRLNSATVEQIGQQRARNQAINWFTAIVSIVGFALLAGIMALLLFRIVGRLNILTGVLHRLADNDMDIRVPMLGKKDEMGDLARALDTVRENALRRQLADERLRDANASLETIVGTIQDGIVAIDGNSEIRMFNSAAETIFGWAEKDAMGKNVSILIPENSRQEHERFVLHSDLHGPKILNKSRDLTGRRRDGSRFPLELTISPAELKGEKVFVAVCRDITRRKAAETEIREKTEMLEMLYQISSKTNRAVTGAEAMAMTLRDVCIHLGLPVGHIYLRQEDQDGRLHSGRIWYLEDSNNFAEFRRATGEMTFGWAEGIPGRVMSSAQPDWIEDVANDPRFKRAAVAGAAGIKSGFMIPVLVRSEVIAVLEFFSCEFLKPNRLFLDALTNVGLQLGRVIERRRAAKALMEKEGVLQEHVATLSRTQQELEEKGRQLTAHRDKLEATVAERTAELAHALEQEKEYNVLQREFVAMASHEFRTPITVIDGEMRRIMKRADGISPAEIIERGEAVRAAVKKMTGLIDSTLSLSRLDAGQIELKLEPCRVKDLVREAAARQRAVSPHHQMTVDVDGLPDEIVADPQLIDQAMSNLLSNATKYSQSDPRIEITGSTEGGTAVIAVRDHGVGIPADELPRMFERFFRATTSTGISGTGIGLTVVKQFVERHGGTVSVESVEGEGSVFTIRLPVDGPGIDVRGVESGDFNAASLGAAGGGPQV